MKSDANTKIRCNSYLRLLLECIEVWAKWYKNDAVFPQGYQDLLQLVVQFPSKRTYFKNINEDMKVRIDNEQAEDMTMKHLDGTHWNQKEIKSCFIPKEVNSQKIKEIFGKFKVYRDKIELLTLKNKENHALDEEIFFYRNSD